MVALTRWLLQEIVVYNGPEFASLALDQWAYRRGIYLRFIRPGRPIDHCFIESFNGKFRDVCMNQRWFLNLEDARRTIEAWPVDYSRNRPHRSVGRLAPEEFLKKQYCQVATGT